MDSSRSCCELEALDSLLAVYDHSTNIFTYHPDLTAFLGQGLENTLLWEFCADTGLLSLSAAAQLRQICLSMGPDRSSYTWVFHLAGKGAYVFVFSYFNEQVHISLYEKEAARLRHDEGSMRRDELTGLLHRNEFCAEMERLVSAQPVGHYAVVYFDVDKFKAINDLFGFSEGDKLLVHIANCLTSYSEDIRLACRESADRFAFLAEDSQENRDELLAALMERIESYPLPIDIYCNVGIYQVDGEPDSGNSMLDKAVLAQSAIKGNYNRKVNHFTSELRDQMLSEQEIVGSMNYALTEEQFVIYYQPQYNHSTGMIVGAEALVRWLHPEKGLISPGLFIPIFEKNGFITRLDLYVFEQVCRFLRRTIDSGCAMVPISTNFSVNDVYSQDFVAALESIRQKYDIPTRWLRLELTEGIMINNQTHTITELFRQLHDCGYIIEMDDFGSGYSSLNVLKDLNFDIIKLDMLFLKGQTNLDRGGTILSSVINMAKWLRMPVIAEGVETLEQADFLKSIGCIYIQGYLYSKPLPEAEYEALLSANRIGKLLPQMDLVDTLDFARFWRPDTPETLIFNNFVGGAAIFQYTYADRSIEVLRLNQQYLQELDMTLREEEIIRRDPDNFLTETDRANYHAMLDRAIATREEQSCDTWRHIVSDRCGTEDFCIHSDVQLIGSSDDRYLFYARIRNVTEERRLQEAMLDTERRFKYASDQANIYFWEYTVATQEMRPCFRCMRDLGFPPLLRNYPESAIENGTFPPEVADMYRDWHVQIANGVEKLEAIIPLTADRIPFHVRYTTEFDENGHPVKAYGSATLVVD